MYIQYLKNKFIELKQKARIATAQANLTPPFEGAVPHHNNYGDPLDITWYTKEEHGKLHKSMKPLPYWQLLSMAGVPYLTKEEYDARH